MVFQRCSGVAEPRVEQAILDAESRRNAASTSDSEQPRRASPYARELLTTTRRGEPTLSIDQFCDLSIDHIIASASPRSTTASLATVKSSEL
jgi:hypothetical protein